MHTIDDKTKEMYKRIGFLLQKYKNGQIPKAFKAIPMLDNWDEIIKIMRPMKWSTQAVLQATRLFVSNFGTNMSLLFFKTVLLPRVRNHILENHHLDPLLIKSLKKATFKPAAFYQGILIPICKSNSCTIREALILCSVLQRVSIPAVHSIMAMIQLLKIKQFGIQILLIKAFLDKNYSLPFHMINLSVNYFVSFRSEIQVLPVIWYNSLQTFIEKNKRNINLDQKLAIFTLLREKFHKVGQKVIKSLNKF